MLVMRLGCSALFLGLVAFVDVESALAQGADDQFIPASHAFRYARYYVPYAIQSSAAHLPVNEMNDRRAKLDAEGYAMDAGYAVQTAVLAPDERLTARAKEAFRSWRYQFGSESYLTCIDPTDSDCQASFNNRGWNFGGGPAFHVWARTRTSSTGGDVCSEVSIAFRGTAGSQWDWISNFGRFGSPYDDYYHQLRRNVDGIIKLIQNLDCYKRARTKPQIVSTGHSLGGGLAQLAALANRSDRPRIAKVFAFDPSPVTGARLVDDRLRSANAQGLTIDRLYQEGEVLSYARSAVEEYPSAKSACNPRTNGQGRRGTRLCTATSWHDIACDQPGRFVL